MCGCGNVYESDYKSMRKHRKKSSLKYCSSAFFVRNGQQIMVSPIPNNPDSEQELVLHLEPKHEGTDNDLS